MKSEKISELTTSRLSVYLRCLNALHAAGIKTISSQALAEQFNLNPRRFGKILVTLANLACVALVTTSKICAITLRRYSVSTARIVSASSARADWVPRWLTTMASVGQTFTVVALDNDRQKIGHRIGDASLLVHDVDDVAPGDS